MATCRAHFHWQPGHSFTLLKNCRHDDLSERVGREILSLPLHSFMSMNTLERVVDGVHLILSQEQMTKPSVTLH
jgi:hypothetical protein